MVSTRSFVRLRRAAGGACLLLALHAPPLAAETVRFTLAHEVYWLGFPVFTMETKGEFDGRHYALASTQATLGLFDLIVDFHSLAESKGALRAGAAGLGVQPESYRHQARWHGEERHVRLDYTGDGPPKADVAPPPEADDRDPVPPELQAGTIDPLSAAVLLGAVEAGRPPCSSDAAIYDGRQRYNLRFESLGSEILEKHVDTVYGGEAIKCHVAIERVAGFMHRWRAEPTRPPSLLWLARFLDGRILLPVKLETETRWGSLVGYLTAISIESEKGAGD